MRGLKIFAWVVSGLVIFGALVVVVALIPGVQTWAVRRALAEQPGTTVGRVAAGLSSAELTDVRVAQDGTVIAIGGISARYSVWDYVSKKRINADQVTVRDIVVDLRQPAPAKAPAPPKPKQPFSGLLAQAKLPFDVRMANLSAQGRALLPDNKTASFELKGNGIETGKRGQLNWTAVLTDPATAAPLRSLRTSGNVGVRIAADRRIDLIDVDGVAQAEGPNLPADQMKLQARAEQPSAGGNENYVASLALVRGANSEPLLRTEAVYDAGKREIAGSWNLTMRTEQLAALLTGLGLPEIAAQGAGKFALNPSTNAVTASGDLQADVSRLEKISPQLTAIGSVQMRTAFAGGLTGQNAQLEQLQIDVTGVGGRRLAQINTTQRVAFNLTDQRVTLADPKAELARVNLAALPLAWAQPFLTGLKIDSGELSLALAVEAEADGSHIRARAIEPLALRSVTIRDGDKKLIEQVTLTARPRVDYSKAKVIAELTDVALTMPAGDALNGTINVDVSNLATKPAIAFAVKMQAQIISALKPYLPLDPGPLSVVLDLAGRQEGDALQLTKTIAQVTRQNGPAVLDLELQQAITADLTKKTFAAANPQDSVARVRLGEIPLAWAQAFVPKSQFAGNVAGGSFEITARTADDLSINATQPLVVRGATASLDGKPTVQNLDLSADFTATMRSEAIRYEVRRLEVKQGATLLAQLIVAGEASFAKKPTIVAKGTLEADIPALSAQPALASFATLSRGRVATTFDVNLGEAIGAKAKISGKGLTAREGNRLLGDLDITVDATLNADGSGRISAPVVLASGVRRSDVAIDGTFSQKTGGPLQLVGRVASTQLYVDDFTPLAGLAPTSPDAPKPAVARPGTRPTTPAPPVAKADTAPFWQAVRGKIDVDLKNVIYGKDYPISGIRGTAVITENRLSLDGLQGRLKENPFKANGVVNFNAQQPKPYVLTGAADVNNFDVGEFLRAANPNERPAIESKVNVTAKLNGTGATVGELGKNVYGTFDLTGSQGVLRALGRKTEMASTGSALLGLAGALTNSNQTVAIAEVTRALSELQFDTFKMQVERGADLSFKLSNIEFVSALMRTTGNGRIVNRGGPDADVQNQPMEILLQFGAKGQLAQLLGKAGVLGQNADEQGYQLLQRTFTVGGTPSKPDSSALWKFLIGEAATRGLPALQDLLNRR